MREVDGFGLRLADFIGDGADAGFRDMRLWEKALQPARAAGTGDRSCRQIILVWSQLR